MAINILVIPRKEKEAVDWYLVDDKRDELLLLQYSTLPPEHEEIKADYEWEELGFKLWYISGGVDTGNWGRTEVNGWIGPVLVTAADDRGFMNETEIENAVDFILSHLGTR